MSICKIESIIKSIDQISWFKNLGKKIEEKEMEDILTYIASFDKKINYKKVNNWNKVKRVIVNPDFNITWNNLELQYQVQLYAKALKYNEEKQLLSSLKCLNETTIHPIYAAASTAANSFKVFDIALARCAAGAASLSCYQAAIAIAAKCEPQHPFLAKYRLFSRGRWPLSIVKSHFYIF